MAGYVIYPLLGELCWLVLIIGFISQGWPPAPSLMLVLQQQGALTHASKLTLCPAETG